MTKTHSIAQLKLGFIATLFSVALAGPAFSQTAPAAQGAAQGNAEEEKVNFTASPWQKICQENPQNKKKVCVLSQILGVEDQAIAKVDLVEMEGEPKKRLNVSVPLGMRLQPGMRITLDKDPIAIPFVICQPIQGGGATCLGDVEVTNDFVAKLKKANAVYLQMVNGPGRTLSLPISNGDFGKAYDSPGVDAKVAMEQEQKRMEEARAKQQALEEQNKAALMKKGQELERAQSGK
ncbi:invasion associated locus B family protein [Xanthobacter sp. TB0136]|uniref:invasion associated locus B family protein n=1 Tax=Xanthobacter sp. TB0136 TaxID=3459177 RepID=UPI00403A2480